ncbi:MAG TPA: hypothetical protein VGR96_19950, partial [Acidobacteriaceae bacterium]|nr:hypothetical protein [Acidobacteriaceae bacterium]
LVIVQRSELFLHELAVMALAAWLAGSHQRMLFVFGILTAPILCRLLSSSWENYDPAEDRVLPNAVLLLASLLVVWAAFPSLRNLTRQVEEHSPVRAVNFIKSHRLAGPMLNEYVYGGYLAWAAPEHPVFVDGRADVFEWTGVLARFGDWATLQSDPEELLNRYQIAFCLLARDSSMARVLPLLEDWKAVYSDDQSIIFVRSGAGSRLQ